VLEALHRGKVAIAEALIKKGASIAGETCGKWLTKGYNALHCAVYSPGLEEFTRVLLARCSTTELLQQTSPVNAMHIAVAVGNNEGLKRFLDAFYTGMKAQSSSAAAGRLADEATIINCKAKSNGDSLMAPATPGTSPPRPSWRSAKLDPRRAELIAPLLEVQIRRRELQWSWTLSRTCTTNHISSGTPLHVAAFTGNASAARILLRYGALVDSLDEYFRTPLHLACMNGYLDVVKLLLERGANINARELNWSTPVSLAIEKGRIAILEYLVNQGADLSLLDLRENTVLLLAMRSGHPGALSLFLDTESFAEIQHKPDYVGMSPWRWAFTYPKEAMCTLILNSEVDLTQCEPMWGSILNAPYSNETVSLLKRVMRRLPKEVVSRFINYKSTVSRTPLYEAAARSRDQVMEILINAGAEIEAEGGELGTPLMAACAAGRLGAVEVLIQRGARTSYLKDGKVVNAIETAKYYPPIVQYLLVGRYTKQLKLTAEPDCGIEREVSMWSGLSTIDVPKPRQISQSLWDYLRYTQWEKKMLQGKVWLG